MKLLFSQGGGCIMNKKFFYSSLVIGLAILAMLAGSCRKAPKPKPKPRKESVTLISERGIEIKAEGETLHYSEKKKWAPDEFSKIMEEQDKFRSDQIKKFKETYRVNAGNFEVGIDKNEKTTGLKCDIYVKFVTWYDFHWFLRPLGLDFIDDHFERRGKELSWKGYLNGVETIILLKFPFRINNCHAHVWSAQ
jgi:hypothetical protein